MKEKRFLAMKCSKKLLALLLVLCMVIPSVNTFATSTETEETNTYSEVAEAEGGTVLVGSTLVSEDFSGLETGATTLPDGWVLIKDVGTTTDTSEKTDWLWDASKATTTKMNDDTGVGLKLSAGESDGLLAAPSLGVVDYVMTATIKCTSGRTGGIIGLASNIKDPVSDSVGATVTSVYTTNSDSKSIEMRNIWNTGTDAQKYLNQQTIDAVEKGILESLPEKYTELKLAICSINGKTYFYINDKYVGVIEQTNPETEESLCGFFVTGTGILIKDVKVQKLDVIDLDMLDIAVQQNLSQDNVYRFIASVDDAEKYLSSGFVFSKTSEVPRIGESGCIQKENSDSAYYKGIKAVFNAGEEATTKYVADLYGEKCENSSALFIKALKLQAAEELPTLYVCAYVTLEDGTVVYGNVGVLNRTSQ